jgi:hypothetical protein
MRAIGQKCRIERLPARLKKVGVQRIYLVSRVFRDLLADLRLSSYRRTSFGDRQFCSKLSKSYQSAEGGVMIGSQRGHCCAGLGSAGSREQVSASTFRGRNDSPIRDRRPRKPASSRRQELGICRPIARTDFAS